MGTVTTELDVPDVTVSVTDCVADTLTDAGEPKSAAGTPEGGRAADGAPTPLITIAEAGLADVVSWEVATPKPVEALLLAPGLPIPAIVMVPVVLKARAQPPESVIVTTWPVVEPVDVPVQVPLKPLAKRTVGVVGRVKPAGKVTVMVFGAANAPNAEVVNVTPQVEVSLATNEAGANVTLAGAVPATAVVAVVAVGSSDVATLYKVV
jgi:hypothetical protein